MCAPIFGGPALIPALVVLVSGMGVRVFGLVVRVVRLVVRPGQGRIVAGGGVRVFGHERFRPAVDRGRRMVVAGCVPEAPDRRGLVVEEVPVVEVGDLGGLGRAEPVDPAEFLRRHAVWARRQLFSDRGDW